MKHIDVTVRTVEENTFRVAVDDDFDPRAEDALVGYDVEEYPRVDSNIKEWSIIDIESV
ncbi:hypothetical protein H7J07_05925 [Mycobacterium koreense]|uniref:hypothetical protein n=1 Tax=Mycolicibacillus koreensis TaxID=1069220 RepID=UPI00138BEA3D|nr:hypothetical protein [Mycolicibacillus koreensis]MCV7247764.1 hypothetical protein [Mycolicibacillus koreensis]BBY54147.1 hypothetical protein MKOR_13980 [Mycolicibacillus koreensis]